MIQTTSDGARACVDEAFSGLLDHLVESSPVAATQLGDHSRDHELDDWTADEADRRLRAVAHLRAQLDDVHADGDAEVAGDLLLLRDTLDGIEFELAEQRAHERDPLFYLNLATASVYELIRRDDLHLAPRRHAAAARARHVPRLLEQAMQRLTDVCEPHRDLALLRLAGAEQLFGDVLPSFAPDAEESGPAAAAACRRFAAWLEDRAGPYPDWRLGERRWNAALRLALGVRMPADQLWDRAHAAVADDHDTLASVSTALLGSDAAGLHGDALISAGVERAAADRSDRRGVVRDAAGVLGDIQAFIRETGAFALPERDELRVEEVPPFMQGAVVAYFVPAPPLETDAAHTYYLSPVPDRWSDEQAMSFLREYNVHALRSVGIHEAYPGHYVQLEHALRHPRLLRRALWNSAFAEGWAVYAEQRLIELGFGEFVGADEAMRLTSAKMDLRSVANALLDQGLHVHGWSDEQAMDVMTRQAFQERAEAEAKLVRAKTTGGQLSTYFVGVLQMRDIRDEAQRSGGATFDEARFHADVLAQGTPPFEVIRTAVLSGGAA